MKEIDLDAKYEWTHKEADPQFTSAGEFEGWIAGSSRKNHSAASWKVQNRLDSNDFFTDCKPSGENDSSHNRGYLAAIAGCLETLQPGSTIVIRTNSEYAAESLNNIEANALNDWSKTNHSPLENLDILRRIHQVIQRRNLKATAIYHPLIDKVHGKELKIQKETARAKLQEKASV